VPSSFSCAKSPSWIALPSTGANVGALAHLFEGFRHVFFGNVHRGHLELQLFVIAQFEFRQHFKYCPELQRLPFVEIQLVHLRLRDGRQFLFGNGLFHALGHQRLQHFSFDVIRELASNQRNGRLPAAKSRHVRNARKFLRHAFNLFRYFFRGNLQLQLAAAGCFSHTTVLSWDNHQISGDVLAAPRQRASQSALRLRSIPGDCASIAAFGRGQKGKNSPCNSNSQYRRPSQQRQLKRSAEDHLGNDEKWTAVVD
jgi:hypothetical protein